MLQSHIYLKNIEKTLFALFFVEMFQINDLLFDLVELIKHMQYMCMYVLYLFKIIKYLIKCKIYVNDTMI